MSQLNAVFLQQIIKMFLMMLIGFAAVRCRLLPADSGRGLSQVAVGIIKPCAILYAFQVDYAPEKARGLLLAVLAAVLTHVVFIGLTWLLGRGLMRLSAVERASMIYSNSGNLLMPLIAASMGQEWLFYTCAYVAVLNLFAWTHGKSLICGERQVDWRRVLWNVNILAIVLGFVCFFARISFPGPLGLAVESLAGAQGAASMLAVGISFASITRLDTRRLSGALLVSLHRLVLFPLVMLALFLLSGLTEVLPGARQILLITLLAAGAPSGVVVTQIAQIYGKDEAQASAIGVLTMLGSLVTLPALIYVYESLCVLL